MVRVEPGPCNGPAGARSRSGRPVAVSPVGGPALHGAASREVVVPTCREQRVGPVAPPVGGVLGAPPFGQKERPVDGLHRVDGLVVGWGAAARTVGHGHARLSALHLLFGWYPAPDVEKRRHPPTFQGASAPWAGVVPKPTRVRASLRLPHARNPEGVEV